MVRNNPEERSFRLNPFQTLKHYQICKASSFPLKTSHQNIMHQCVLGPCSSHPTSHINANNVRTGSVAMHFISLPPTPRESTAKETIS